MSHPAIIVDGISKKYRIGLKNGRTRPSAKPPRPHYPLRFASLALGPGMRLTLIELTSGP